MTELMDSALDLTAVGMGFVFSFLIILVFVTMVMSAVAMRLTPDEPAPPSGSGATARKSDGSPPMEDRQLMAVISAAVSRYRARHRK